MMDVAQQLLFPSKQAEKSWAKSLVPERRHPPAPNIPDRGTWSRGTAALCEREPRKRRRGAAEWPCPMCRGNNWH